MEGWTCSNCGSSGDKSAISSKLCSAWCRADEVGFRTLNLLARIVSELEILNESIELDRNERKSE